MSVRAASRFPRPAVTPTRVAVGILLGLFAFSLALPAVDAHTWAPFAYFGLVVVTIGVINGLRREPGSWLGRRVVRCVLVFAIALVSVGLLTFASPAPTGGGTVLMLLLLLTVLNVAVGRATQRVATAPDSLVDEREEALRNRAHRIAYALVALLVGGTLAFADVAAPASRDWLSSVLRGGGWIVVLELIFVLPAMVFAVLEPDRLQPETSSRSDQRARARAAAGLVLLTFAIPIGLSLLLLVLPVQLTANSSANLGQLQIAESGAAGAVTGCKTFNADARVGRGIEADIPLSAEGCWNGRVATEGYGMNSSDCLIRETVMTTVKTLQCSRTTSRDGTLHFTYRVAVASSLLPFVSRDVTVQLELDRTGNVVRFP